MDNERTTDNIFCLTFYVYYKKAKVKSADLVKTYIYLAQYTKNHLLFLLSASGFLLINLNFNIIFTNSLSDLFIFALLYNIAQGKFSPLITEHILSVI